MVTESWLTMVDDEEPAPVSMPRGWQEQFQNRCDKCGRFVNANAPGVSWAVQWTYDYYGTPELHDATHRCSLCTDKHGLRPTNCNERDGKYHGRNEVKP